MKNKIKITFITDDIHDIFLISTAWKVIQTRSVKWVDDVFEEDFSSLENALRDFHDDHIEQMLEDEDERKDHQKHCPFCQWQIYQGHDSNLERGLR